MPEPSSVTDMEQRGELTVQVVSPNRDQDRVYMLAHVPQGVRVREWNGGNWSGTPDERVLGTEDVWTLFQDVGRRRWRLEPSLYEIRSWLDARAL